MSGLIRTVRAFQQFGVRSAPLRIFAAQPALLRTFSASALKFKAYPPHVVIDMPALSPTMEAGNVGAWKKQIGDKLAPGDVLVEVETDKATMDFEFQEDGYLAKILVEEGTNDVPVGKPVGVYVENAEDVPAFADFTIEAGSAAPAAPAQGAPEGAQGGAPAAPQAAQAAQGAPASTSSASSSAAPAGRIFASPRAKLIALEKGIKISEVKGSGPNGRVIAKDVESFVPKPVAASANAAKPSTAAPSASSAPAAPASANYEDIPVSQMRSTIAKRLRQSKNEAPDFIVSSDISVSKLLQLRKSLNAAANGAYKISVNDILVKAIALALRKYPAPNTHWLEDQKVMRQFKSVDISVAVSTPKGLITPIVFNAESKGLSEISSSVKDLAKRARDNKLKPEEFQGGTITISNLGMNNAVSQFTAIINPPQSAIIAIGSVQRKAIEDPLQESGISFDDVMNITGTFDHRVVDGAVAGDFMKELKNILESPLKLLL